MFKRLQFMRAFAAATALGAAACAASAQSINVGATNPDWFVSFDGGSGRAFHYPCPVHGCISISSNGRADGEFVGDGRADLFKGSWTGTLSFALPSDAEAAVMDLVIHGVDDRATLFLNGRAIIGTYLAGAADVAVHLTEPWYFIFGGSNTLEVQVTNNPWDVSGPPLPFQFFGDATAYSLSGSVTAVPEPSIWALMLAGTAIAVARQRRLQNAAVGGKR